MSYHINEEVLQAQVENNSLYNICQRCEFLLYDFTLNNNRKFRKAVDKSPKGYIDIQLLQKDPIVTQILKTINVIGEESGKIIIRRAINEYSKNLKANWQQVKRIQPYIDRIKQNKPIYVDKVPPSMPKQ